MDRALVRIDHPFDRGEIAVAESILTAEGIHYLVPDGNLGPEMSGRAGQCIFVFKADEGRALEALAPLIEGSR